MWNMTQSNQTLEPRMTLEKFFQKLSKTPEYFGQDWSINLCREFRLYTDDGGPYCPITAVGAMELNRPIISLDEATQIGLRLGLSRSTIYEIISAADYYHYPEDFERNNPLLEEMIKAVKGVVRDEA